MKTFLPAVAIGIIALIFGTYFVFQKPNSTPSENKTAENTSSTNSSTSNLATSNGKYIEYFANALESNKGKRRVLFFYANWCPTCRPADTDFKENSSKIPEDVVLIRVNYNDPETDQEEKDLANKYGVTYQHTFVQINSEGNELAKWNGGKTNELLTKIK